MASQPGITQPENFNVRNPMSRPQKNGRVVNPVGYAEMGGGSGPGFWAKGNEFRVESATKVSAGKRAYEKKISK